MREEKLKEARELFKKHEAILLNWATGLGKTLASLKLVDQNKKIIVLCQELTHIDNWRKELQKYGLEFDIEFYTYASMHKISGSNYDLILDESHWCTSDLRRDKLAKLKFDRIILLSASMEDNEIDLIKTVIPNLAIHIVTLQEAIDAGILPKPEIQVVELELDNTVKQCVHFAKRGHGGPTFTCTFGTFYKTLKQARKNRNYYVVCACTEKQKYQLLKGEADSIKRKAFNNKNLWKVHKYKVLAMKRFISHIKTQKANIMVKMLRSKGKRFIAFTASIDQANQIGLAVHSKNSTKQNQQIIDDFKNKVTDELITVRMLRESVNLTDIEAGLIVQLDNKMRSPLQMIGRVLRGEDPKIYILNYVNTIDDEYVRNNLTDEHVRVQARFITP